MSQYNIGPRVGIEGEEQFRQQISRINSEYRSMDSYLKTLDRSMAQNGKSQEALAAKGNVLRQQLALQEQRYNALSEALEKVRSKENASAQEIMRYEGALLDVKNTQEQLTRELADTEDEMRRLAEGIEDVGDSAEVAEPKMLSFGDVVKAGIASGTILNTLERVGEMIVDIGGQAIEAAADVNAANAQFEQTFGELKSRATSALEAISDKTGVAVTRLQGGYTALYAFTRSVGGDQETSLNIAQRALTAAADSAAYYDRTMEDATETLQSFLKGNYANDAALGIAATETTRNAKANELYAKSFKELSEAQKVDVLLAMVEAGNAASGALGQAAREADSWANVTGELSEAWRQLLAKLGGPLLSGLIPIIQGITDAMNGWMAQTSGEKLSQGLADFRAELEAADAAARESTNSIAATTGLAQQYVDRLRELEGAGLDAADAQREYAQVVELLNALMPELGLTINEVTGRLEQNTWAIEDNIQSLKKQAENQAKMAYYKKIIDSYTAAYEQQYAAQTRLVQLEEEEARIREQLHIAEQQQMAANIRGNYEEIAVYREKYNAYSFALREVLLEKDELIPVLEEFNAALAAEEAALDEATAGYAELAGATSSVTTATDEQSEAVAALGEAYLQAKTDARNSIDSQIGLFDELATKSEMSAREIVKNWKEQEKAFANYEDNLKKAVELGLDETLVAQLSDGTQQSMLMLDALVNDTEISVDEINAAFGGRLDAKESLTGYIGELEVIMSGAYDDMIAMSKAAGYDTVAGLAAGIRSNFSIMENAMRDMGKKAQLAFNRTMEIQSPSRVMARAGGYVVAGVVQGVEQNSRDLEKAMSELATAGQVAYQDQLDAVAQYPSMMQGVPGYGTSTTTNNRSVAYGGINITINAQAGQDAHSIADAVLEELTVRLGQEEAAF